MSKVYKVAVVGATGLVGSKMIEVLSEHKFPVGELVPVASERSAGKIINCNGKEFKVVTPAEGVAAKPDIANAFYEQFVAACRAKGLPVETGVFRAHMLVELVNNGPVTILLDSSKLL